MSLSTDPYKGVQDYYPEDWKIEKYLFDTWRKVAERFGYEEYNASPLEPTELYTEKSGEEIVGQQTFTFTDRGGRSVTLRPEMTPTLARMIAAKGHSLKLPIRWYSIPNLFRYERPQKGRRREHYQLNVDVLGIADLSADVEIVNVAYSILKELGARDEDFEIRVNHPGGNKGEAEEFINKLSDIGIKNARFDESLARGQTYYTGVVFEIFDTDGANSRSICGGGRYDNLMELFDVPHIPTVGFGMGDIALKDFLETHKLPLHA